MSREREFIVTLSCRDTPGIVFAVSGLLYHAGCNIIDSQQFGDGASVDATGLFFMRVHFEAPAHLADAATLHRLLTSVREQYRMDARLHAVATRPRVLLPVCLKGVKGAKPYLQAHALHTRLIGATAHYVTADLDQGPFLEQGVEPMDHNLPAEDFSAVGRDIDCVELARAVRWHVEHRVPMNRHKTVVFS